MNERVFTTLLAERRYSPLSMTKAWGKALREWSVRRSLTKLSAGAEREAAPRQKGERGESSQASQEVFSRNRHKIEEVDPWLLGREPSLFDGGRTGPSCAGNATGKGSG